MIQFTYSFCMALLHSFWQAALLLLLYIVLNKLVHKNNAPLAKRNFLFGAISVQLILFVLTFFIYFFNSAASGGFTTLTQNINAYLGSDNVQPLTLWVFNIYLFIIAFKLVKAFYTWYNFKHQYKAGLQKPTVDLKLFTELKAHQFGIKRKVKLWLSHSVQTPVTFGYFKPIILLPVALVNHISTQQAETLILHELTHIRTNDYLLNWVLLLAETFFFFNPFILSICKNIRLEREKNCDINVISFEYSPALYAETLLQAERMKQLVPNFQLAAVNRKKHLLQRIQFFTNEKIINQTLRFNIVAPFVGLVLLLLLSTAVLFQSGKTASHAYSAEAVQYLPLNNFIITETEEGQFRTFENKVITAPATETHTECAKPAAPAVKETPQPVSKPEPKIIEEITKPVELNFALPVSATENDATRQIIIKEEGSGTATVKVYYLSFQNGKWILQPEWALTAKEITDSLLLKHDSSKEQPLKTYPAQQ